MFSYISLNGNSGFRRCYLKILYTTNQNMNMDISAACIYFRQGDVLRFGVSLYDAVLSLKVSEGYLCINLLKEV